MEALFEDDWQWQLNIKADNLAFASSNSGSDTIVSGHSCQQFQVQQTHAAQSLVSVPVGAPDALIQFSGSPASVVYNQ